MVKTKRSYHHGALRQALLDAAADLLAEYGRSGVSLREAARRAGVSQAAPYHYFPSRAALLDAVADAGRAALAAQEAAALVRAGADPTARLTALVTTHIRFAIEHPQYFGAMPPQVSERVAEAVHDARFAAGHDDLDPPAMATLIWSIPHGLVSLYLNNRAARDRPSPVVLEHLARTATEALLQVPAQDVAADWAV